MLLTRSHDGYRRTSKPYERLHSAPQQIVKVARLKVTFICGCEMDLNKREAAILMAGKSINEMTDQELLEEIERMRAVQPPAGPARKSPKRLDETPKKKRGWMDDLIEG